MERPKEKYRHRQRVTMQDFDVFTGFPRAESELTERKNLSIQIKRFMLKVFGVARYNQTSAAGHGNSRAIQHQLCLVIVKGL